MQNVTTVLFLLFFVVLSGLVGRVARISLPILQISLGALCALAGWHVGFNPDMFLLLFIAPLLYVDAKLTPMREFRELRWTILMMAMGLVLFTTLGCGLFLHWLIPSFSLSVCFTLAAVLSPTDAVAVGGMIKGKGVPRRFMYIVQGEALLNDASGLVCFKFGVAAALTGLFSFTQALKDFFIIAIGGVVVGAAIAWVVTTLVRYLLRRGFDDPPTQIMLLALLPFAVYLVADQFGLSGILAAVSAGMTVRLSGISSASKSNARLYSGSVWSMIVFLFNALIFILFGFQLPVLLQDGILLTRDAGVSPWQLALVIVEITGALILLRFAWVWLSLLARTVAARLRHTRIALPSLRAIGAMSIAGVRGAVTLAAVLSLPVASGNTAGFPHREFLIVAAAGVIVLSLILANLTLPVLIKGLSSGQLDPGAVEADHARAILARRAVRELELQQAELARNSTGSEPSSSTNGADARKEEVLAHLLPEYQDRLHRFDDSANEKPEETVKEVALAREREETAIRLHVMRAEREELRQMLRERQINDETDRLLQKEIDLAEQALLQR